MNTRSSPVSGSRMMRLPKGAHPEPGRSSEHDEAQASAASHPLNVETRSLVSVSELRPTQKPRRSGAVSIAGIRAIYLFELFGLPCWGFWSAGSPLLSLPLPCLADGCCERSPPCPVVAG